MAANQLKQSLWFMREILQSGARGISREELCSKWAASSMNDYPWEEATFQRTRQWLSIGLCPDGIYFYIVSDEQDYELREQRALEGDKNIKQLNLDLVISLDNERLSEKYADLNFWNAFDFAYNEVLSAVEDSFETGY